MHAVFSRRRIQTWLFPALLAGITLAGDSLLAGETAFAANPAPGEITLIPQTSLLRGWRATQQMIATSRAADGSVQDATRSVEWLSLDPSVAIVSSKGRVVPKGNGTTKVVARLGSHEWGATVQVEGMDRPAPVSFRRDVIPSFSQAGCNMGACHGTPTGKGGFRLSLRGYLPDQDFTILSHETGGRRINPIAAETSLLLRKPLGEVPHEGGLRLARGSKTYEFIHDWIREGAKDDPGATPAVRLEILPESRVLIAPAATQQLLVFVYDANNRARDITPICYYD
jgi:Bacterial Ig-like domain (group 2)